VSPYPDTGKDFHHPHQQQNKLFRLFRCPGICRTSVRIQPALIADAYAATVPGAAVRTHFQKLAVLGHTSVTTDIKMIPRSVESAPAVADIQIIFREALVLARGGAMDYY